jgi:polyhydroxybutyrate depolymerase
VGQTRVVRHRIAAVVLLALIATAAPLVAGTPPAAAGTPAPPTGNLGPFTLQHDGVDRDYRVYVPTSYDGTTPLPLVLGLHGGCGYASHFLSEYGWSAQAEQDGFIVVAPRGLSPGGQGICATWNAGRCCPDPPVAADDVGFLTALLDEAQSTWTVDPDRILVTGMSNGAMMAHRLACESPEAMTMVGVVAGSLEAVPPCTPAEPVTVLAFHGDQDEVVPFAGGGGSLLEGFVFRPVSAALETWRSLHGCDRTPTVTTLDGVERSTWPGCAAGTSVHLVRIDDHPHAWPGAPSTTPSGAVPSQKVDATAELASALLASSAPGLYPDHGFPDVTAFFDPGVTWLAMQGITTGYDDGTYRTGATVNRMQVAAFLFRMVGDPSFVAPSSPTFSDVSPAHPFFREVEWLHAAGITTGWADGTFRPTSALSRSAFATLLWRVAGEPVDEIPDHTFPDLGPNDAVDWLAFAGITTGYDDGTFRPAGSLNRGQVATFLHRLAGTHWA